MFVLSHMRVKNFLKKSLIDYSFRLDTGDETSILVKFENKEIAYGTTDFPFSHV